MYDGVCIWCLLYRCATYDVIVITETVIVLSVCSVSNEIQSPLCNFHDLLS